MKESRFRLITANFVIVAMLAVTMGIAVAATMPIDSITANTSAIYSGNSKGESVSLMFNVYQNTPETLEIAEIFKSYGFNTTFFVGGSWVNRNGDALLTLASNGFEIGNHGYLHRDHAKLSLKQNIDEIKMTEVIIATTLSSLNIVQPSNVYAESPSHRNRFTMQNNTLQTAEIGCACAENATHHDNLSMQNNTLQTAEIESATDLTVSSMLFAPPSGSIGKNMFDACEQLGMKVIMWTRDTIDWRDQDADLIYTRAIKNIKAGDLILMHPTKKSVEALPRILEYIKSIGLRADTVTSTLK